VGGAEGRGGVLGWRNFEWGRDAAEGEVNGIYVLWRLMVELGAECLSIAVLV
jgi:hypothetical protein